MRKKLIQLNVESSDDAIFSVYVNGIKKFNGNKLSLIDVDDFDDHFLRIKVECEKGHISVGRINLNFCQDINQDLEPEQRKEVYRCRLLDIPSTVNNPYTYRENANEDSSVPLTSRIMTDERFNIKFNGEQVDLTKVPHDEPEHFSRVGWCYYLEKGETLEFDVNLLVPLDYLQFIIEQNLDEEYFNEILPTRR